MYPTTLITALVPTIGHKALVQFMANIAERYGTRASVIISSRSFEPVSGKARLEAFSREFKDNKYVEFRLHEDDDAPQNPSTPAEWAYWRLVVKYFAALTDTFVSSETYGAKMAKILGVEFIPFDIERNMLNVRGTEVRDNLFYNFDQIMPSFAKTLTTTVTLFGQESCGKTTMTKWLNDHFSFDDASIMIHEFARPYLENMEDKTVTKTKMNIIEAGQIALQETAKQQKPRPLIFQDTDILSTYGYNKIYDEDYEFPSPFKVLARAADLYIVMNDAIPFEADALRYGGDVRESNKQFWIDILEKYNLDYYVVENTDRELQKDEILEVIYQQLELKFKPIRDFKRD